MRQEYRQNKLSQKYFRACAHAAPGTSPFQLALRLVPLTLGLMILVLIPSASEHILESVLECTTVHVNQALFLLGLWMTEHRNKT